ncbi:MAG: hypothetical protein ABSD29_05655 [Verrucomicrobiota bacterium]|jgi:hypothetical protein
MKFLLSLTVLAAACTALAQGTSEAILGYSANTGQFVNGTAGWTFQPTNTAFSVTITSLGCFDAAFVNGVTNIQVGLWGPDGSLLASNSVTTSSTEFDQSRYVSITPVALTPTLIYQIGVFNSGGLSLDIADPAIGGSVSNSPDIQLDGIASSTSGFVSPVLQVGTAGSIYVGPNFQYQRSSPVPEPCSCLLLSLGALLLAARRRPQRL